LETTYPKTQHHVPEDFNPNHIDMGFVWSLQQARIAFLNRDHLLVLIMDSERVLCEVRTEFSNRIYRYASR